WQALVVDGHDVDALLGAYETASLTPERPTVLLARTMKGKGLLDVEGKEGQHGKALDADHADRVVTALEAERHGNTGPWRPRPVSLPWVKERAPASRAPNPPPPYAIGGKPVAPRK